jgi:hypothetical protein
MTNIYQQKIKPVSTSANDSFAEGVCRLLRLGLYGDAWVGQEHSRASAPSQDGILAISAASRQMKAEVLVEVKKEVEKMLEAGFIRLCRYVEWISSVVPVQKKDGRW